jgi:hypothetical protein
MLSGAQHKRRHVPQNQCPDYSLTYSTACSAECSLQLHRFPAHALLGAGQVLVACPQALYSQACMASRRLHQCCDVGRIYRYAAQLSHSTSFQLLQPGGGVSQIRSPGCSQGVVFHYSQIRTPGCSQGVVFHKSGALAAARGWFCANEEPWLQPGGGVSQIRSPGCCTRRGGLQKMQLGEVGEGGRQAAGAEVSPALPLSLEVPVAQQAGM